MKKYIKASYWDKDPTYKKIKKIVNKIITDHPNMHYKDVRREFYQSPEASGLHQVDSMIERACKEFWGYEVEE